MREEGGRWASGGPGEDICRPGQPKVLRNEHCTSEL